MRSRPDPAAASRRSAVRAALLVLPALLAAPAASAQWDGVPDGYPPRRADERPRPPESPTPQQIEEAHRRQVELGDAQRGWQRTTVIAPRAARAGEDGVEVLPFEGFAVSVETVPEGAIVAAGGQPLGESPVMATVACKPGASLTLRAEKAPLPPREVAVACRKDALVKWTVRLAPSAPPTAAPAKADAAPRAAPR